MDIGDYRFIEEIKRLPFVQSIWLFGSRAKGTNRPTSDIDIAIDCLGASENDWLRIGQIIENADTLFKVDYVRLDALQRDEKLKSSIMKNKVQLFDKNAPIWTETFHDLGKALSRLEEVLQDEKIERIYKLDVVIHRFEFVFELFWKTFQKISQAEGLEVNSPKGALKAAFSLKLIEDEMLWLGMLQDRNLTVHTYKEALAGEIFQRISLYSPELRRTYDRIENLKN